MTHTAVKDVLSVLQRSILVDGFKVVFDHKQSRRARFVDAQTGKAYIDFFSFFASNPIGFNHPKMSDPQFEIELLEVAKVKISNSDIYTTQFADFVSSFHKHFAPMFDKLFFIDGGALGVENAIKTAQDWKVQKNLAAGKAEKGVQVMHFREAFHGRTGYTMSLTNTDPTKTKYFAKFDWPRITNPKVHFPLTEESLEKTKKLEVQAEKEIKKAFQDRPDEICCILLETIQGEGGDNFFRKEFLQKLKSLALENDALLIFDEVQTGFGFTGKRWAFENFDVQPDLIAFGKKVQVCGCAAKMERLNEVENVFKVSSRINSTWGGNLTDMVRCTKFIEIITEENLIENAKSVGQFMLREVQKLSEANEIISNPRGLGLWMAFDLPSKKVRDQAIDALYKNGLMILPCGQNSIRIRPVLDIHKDEAEEGIEIIRKTLSRLA